MSYLKAKMHQIRFQLWLRRPQTPLRELTILPDSLAGCQGFSSKRKMEESGGIERGNKSPECLSQKLGTTANAAVNSETARNLIK